MDGCDRREAEKELEMQEELKKKKKRERERERERNRIGRTNYLVVKWPGCSVFPILTEEKELRAY